MKDSKAFYHGSKLEGLKQLEVNKTNHGSIYLTTSRLVALTYAVRGFPNLFISKDGKEVFLEIKPNLFKNMFDKKKAYIYHVESGNYKVAKTNQQTSRDNCYISDRNVKIISCEKIDNAFEELNKYVASGELKLMRFEEFSKEHSIASTKT